MSELTKRQLAILHRFEDLLKRWWKDELTGEEACLKMVKQRNEVLEQENKEQNDD